MNFRVGIHGDGVGRSRGTLKILDALEVETDQYQASDVSSSTAGADRTSRQKSARSAWEGSLAVNRQGI